MAVVIGERGIGRTGEGACGREGGVLAASGEEREGAGEVVAKGLRWGEGEEEEGRARLKETVRGVAEKGPGSGGRRAGEGDGGAGARASSNGLGGEEGGSSMEEVESKWLWVLFLDGSPESESELLGVRAGRI